ncbi:uncharacterized protein EV154DRAFT_421556 [Mucor mucedo]|uniref:uncharacterized protein n=1 Tax=Mucor mucedo TaxID=29922 RepID=UPI00221F130E|nr:uncharacterized protein EV154DRAFT_421556 [Mucor mucedo]KAI7890735.1 hypothetical protein EV154DRAFT_421556 [Mucor mucedo]
MELPSEEVQDLLDYSSLPAWSPGDFSETSSLADKSLLDFFNASLPSLRDNTEPENKDTGATTIGVPKEQEQPITASTSKAEKKRKEVSSLETQSNKKQKTSVGYECEICQHVFAKKYNLDTHVRTHNKNRLKNHQCSQCNMSFDRSSHLQRHNKTVHQQLKTYSCNYCESKYTRAENLKKHVAKKHADN